MFGGRRKSSVKLTKNQPFSPVFIFFCFLLLSRAFDRHHSHHRPSQHILHHSPTLNNLTWWLDHLSLSLSFPCETLFHLYHRDSSSSSNHSFQRFPPLPAATEATTLSSSTPTVSNPSTDHDSSNPCNSSSMNNVTTACATSSFSVRPPSRQVTSLFLFLPLFLFFFTIHCVNSRREL